ncbi:N-acetylmuramoyl-L-alanine amidase [Megasphaera sp. SC8-1]|uniref:N-acetylmuramoyl-L-alanine amidase family protein n=1 Tax=Megasphaera sp. SC8-1 TaxID=2965102 RepID=UPI00210DC7D2|nr:N-acetylmuramoyl-L-alanine amidase [Megasphaera sp. SC8-1]MCQ4113693.1 N-acetylmuramoyl-L-alanine amidase [Megasphaera sp. SC8-1]
MKVYINPGHDLDYDSGAVHTDTDGTVDLRECDVAAKIGAKVKEYLEAAGCECRILQSDNLYYDSDHDDRPVAVCADANDWEADVFVSIHCNAANGQALGTEVECYSRMSNGGNLAQCIQDQIVSALGTVDRGVKEMPGLIVLRHTDMPAVLVETAFIDNDDDADLLKDKWDDFSRAIARGVTDYECSVQ